MERNNVFYYPGEWREGFYVESKMRCAWAAEIEVLLEIDRICKKYGLTWYASHGTLLGAVRHKGFVPWDDDLDITMKRPDYMRFLEVAQDELPEEWILLHSTGKKVEWEQPIARVVNADTYSLKFDRMKRFHGCPYIVGVDIFPLDYFPSDPDEEEMQKLMATDKAKHTILPLTKFGLMQITRQRVRPVAIEDVTDVCPTCNGTGRIEPTVLLDRKIENQIQFLAEDRGVKHITLRVSPYVASYLCKGLLSLRRRWAWRYKLKLQVVADQSLGMVDVKYLDRQGSPLIE